jgi:hypothetical protein
MKLVSALVGLAALGGVALSTGAASAQPIDVPGASGVVPSGYICNEWGHCWHRHYYGGGYYHPHYWGGYGWHRHWGGGYGWHHWHHWHHWNQW